MTSQEGNTEKIQRGIAKMENSLSVEMLATPYQKF